MSGSERPVFTGVTGTSLFQALPFKVERRKRINKK
jgi:hypothetical protein